jgi:hypothetical protein
MRSHVDPCSFVVFLHVDGERLDAELAKDLRHMIFQQGESPHELLNRLPMRSHQVRFHEVYHYWQGLRLPFVYRYATLALRQAMRAFSHLSRQEQDFTQWSCVLPEFERLSLDMRVGRYGSHLVCGGDETEFPREVEEEIRISPLDLLECATSIAEFQVTAAGDRSDPKVLSRWSKRNPATLEPYKFVAAHLADQALALRCILPLINACFHTSEPVRTFVELLARVWGTFADRDATVLAFLAHPEPCRWTELFGQWLDRLPYEAKPNADGHILGSPYHRVGLDEWVGGHIGTSEGGYLIHPFLGVRARLWIEEQKACPEMEMLMDQPAWVSGEIFDRCMQKFSPTLTVYRVHFDDGDSRTLLAGAPDAGGFTSRGMSTATDWRGFLADFMTMYGAVRRASGAHFDEEQRTCHHRGCPHYEDNFCNSYLIIPSEYSSCGFAKRMANLVNTVKG